VVVVVALRAGPVVVVVDAVVGVVVVALAFGAVVLVVDVAAVVVVVEVDAPVVEVVEVVGVVGGAGDWLTTFPSEVPVSAPPKIVDRGLPEISSMAVMKRSAKTNTMATVPAMARQENPCDVGRRVAGAGEGVDVDMAVRRCVPGVPVVAEISRRSVSSAGAAVDAVSIVSAAPTPFGPDRPTTSVGADDASGSTEDADGPLAPVPPSRRNKGKLSGARTAACLTA
jgi:hypothetical protein